MTTKKKAAKATEVTEAAEVAAADEQAREELARKAEAVTEAGGDLAEILVDGEEPVGWIVRSLHDGYRRAGRAWPAAGVLVWREELDEGQLDILLADPEIVLKPVFEHDPVTGE